MSQAPSPRSKPRSTLAKTGSRCDVALLVMAVYLLVLRPALRCVHLMQPHRLSRRKTKRAAFYRRHAGTILRCGAMAVNTPRGCACSAKRPAPVRIRKPAPVRFRKGGEFKTEHVEA